MKSITSNKNFESKNIQQDLSMMSSQSSDSESRGTAQIASSSSLTTAEESESSFTNSSYFESFETYVETVTFDITSSFTSYTSTEIDFTGDTTLDQFQTSTMHSLPLGQVLVMGDPLRLDSLISAIIPKQMNTTQICLQQGYSSLEDPKYYVECVPMPGVGFKAIIRNCAQGFIFDLLAGICVYAGAKEILKLDLGFKLGPGPGSVTVVPGENPFTDGSDFSKISKQCSTPVASVFGYDDRFFLACPTTSPIGEKFIHDLTDTIR
jgi:hypothetical protein